MNKMSAGEIKERVAQLARIKRLKLAEEIKNRRIAKIKSKLYHKIKRKNKEKEEKLLMEQLEQIDPETAQKLKMKEEEKRVEERIRMRHSMKSKYAKNLMRFANEKDENAKQGLKDLIRIRDERKSKKIELEEDNENSDILSENESEKNEESEKSEENDSENESEQEKNSENEEEIHIQKNAPINIDFSENTKGKASKTEQEKETGLLALKFMKDAEKREIEELKERAKFAQEIENIDSDQEKINEDTKTQNPEIPQKGRVKTSESDDKNYSIKHLQEKIKSATQTVSQKNIYSGWTIENPTKESKKKKKIEELNLLSANDEALEEIANEINKRKSSLGQELIENLEENNEENDPAMNDIVQKAMALTKSVFF